MVSIVRLNGEYLRFNFKDTEDNGVIISIEKLVSNAFVVDFCTLLSARVIVGLLEFMLVGFLVKQEV